MWFKDKTWLPRSIGQFIIVILQYNVWLLVTSIYKGVVECIFFMLVDGFTLLHKNISHFPFFRCSDCSSRTACGHAGKWWATGRHGLFVDTGWVWSSSSCSLLDSRHHGQEPSLHNGPESQAGQWTSRGAFVESHEVGACEVFIPY